ncbi:MAG: hypothetical protein NC338_02510 [Firmicutes bacterium]|nr:hypothetical protein [Bacillota bacterium]MCM1400706.1 hypothetical protein [Bacteroides sp.]MCM1476400.1 hypothetical protein [Bacteroides sp.]
MNRKDIFRKITGAGNSLRAVEKAALSNGAVLSSALVTTIPATFGTGNIGRLAVNTVANRLLAAGALPRYVSATVTVDIDTPPDIIEAVALGMRDAAVQAEMEWGTVESDIIPVGPANGIAISMFGVGTRITAVEGPMRCPQPGDAIIITGPVGATGAAIEGEKKGVEVIAPADGITMTDVMRAAFANTPRLSAALYPIHGIDESLDLVGVKATVNADKVPVLPAVKAACEVMNLNPLSLATADAMLLAVAPDRAQGLIDALQRYPGGEQAAVIGFV